MTMAAQRGHVQVVRLLIKYGAKVDALTPNSMAPLHAAVTSFNVQQQPELVHMLLNAGANVNAPCAVGSPLLGAAANNRLELVRLLIAAGADLDAAAALDSPACCERAEPTAGSSTGWPRPSGTGPNRRRGR